MSAREGCMRVLANGGTGERRRKQVNGTMQCMRGQGGPHAKIPQETNMKDKITKQAMRTRVFHSLGDKRIRQMVTEGNVGD